MANRAGSLRSRANYFQKLNPAIQKVIERKIYAEIPPRVEYFLTPKGKSLLPIISLMKDWGLKYIKEEQQMYMN